MSYSLEKIPYNLVICRYSEIALKKKNRWMFEQFLIGRISSLLGQINKIKVTKIRGRVLIHYHDWSVLSVDDRKAISAALKYVFGLDHPSPFDVEGEALPRQTIEYNLKTMTSNIYCENRRVNAVYTALVV